MNKESGRAQKCVRWLERRSTHRGSVGCILHLQTRLKRAMAWPKYGRGACSRVQIDDGERGRGQPLGANK